MGSGTERVDPIHARRLTRGEHVVDRTPSWQGGRSEKEEGFETIGGWVGEIFFPPIGSFDSPEPVRTGTARHRTRSSRTAEDLGASGSHPRRFTDLPSRLAPLLASFLPSPVEDLLFLAFDSSALPVPRPTSVPRPLSFRFGCGSDRVPRIAVVATNVVLFVFVTCHIARETQHTDAFGRTRTMQTAMAPTRVAKTNGRIGRVGRIACRALPKPIEAVDGKKVQKVAQASFAAAAASMLVAASAMADVTVKLGDDSGSLVFEPANITVAKGEKVTFVNNKGFPHNVVYDEDAVPEGVDADKMSHEDYLNAPGETVSNVFDVPGVYEGYCEPHQGAGMVFKVTVN